MTRLIRLLSLLVALTFVPGAHAGEVRPYVPATFNALMAAGKPVAIAVHASWCPTCKAQKPIQESLLADPAFRDVTLFIVDFDGDQSVLEQFKVRAQSTMIVFHGGHEVGRSVGDTTRAGIEALLRKSLG